MSKAKNTQTSGKAHQSIDMGALQQELHDASESLVKAAKALSRADEEFRNAKVRRESAENAFKEAAKAVLG